MVKKPTGIPLAIGKPMSLNVIDIKKLIESLVSSLAWFEPDGQAKMSHNTQIYVLLTKNELEATGMTLSDHI